GTIREGKRFIDRLFTNRSHADAARGSLVREHDSAGPSPPKGESHSIRMPSCQERFGYGYRAVPESGKARVNGAARPWKNSQSGFRLGRTASRAVPGTATFRTIWVTMTANGDGRSRTTGACSRSCAWKGF